MGTDARRRTEPEDVLQSTIMTFFERLDRFPDDLDQLQVRAYLMQVAKWTIGDVLRAVRGEVGESVLEGRDAAAPQHSTGEVTRQDDIRWTREQIEGLPDLYAPVLWAFYVDGLSVARTAATLGLNPDAVKKRLARGRELLRAGEERSRR